MALQADISVVNANNSRPAGKALSVSEPTNKTTNGEDF
jgi:hypothetical protein